MAEMFIFYHTKASFPPHIRVDPEDGGSRFFWQLSDDTAARTTNLDLCSYRKGK
jgi:hypothetical protein